MKNEKIHQSKRDGKLKMPKRDSCFNFLSKVSIQISKPPCRMVHETFQCYVKYNKGQSLPFLCLAEGLQFVARNHGFLHRSCVVLNNPAKTS
jgi:hypothetical protein